ncbi:MAG: isoprenylcysteine carboxylmethyltransferase family protein [Planctomycetales bacterium]
MTTNEICRILLIGGFLGMTAVGLYYRLKSRVPGEQLDRTQEGVFIMIGLRLTAAATLVGMIAYMIEPQWMNWSAIPLPFWLRLLGAFGGACASGLSAWTFHSLGKNLTDTVVVRRDHSLVTDGPYRWMRHPLYAAVLINVFSLTLLTASWFFLLGGGIVFAFLVLRTRVEEERLIECFGDDYRDYMPLVGRFLPRLRRTEPPRNKDQ